MNPRPLLFAAFAWLAAACTTGEPEVARTAADPAVTARPVARGSGVLRAGFDPQSLAPGAAPAPSGSAVDPHAHHHHHAP